MQWNEYVLVMQKIEAVNHASLGGLTFKRKINLTWLRSFFDVIVFIE